MNPRHYILATRQGSSVITTFGKIIEFNSTREDWPQYEERLSHLFTANGIDNGDKKHTVFLLVTRAATYMYKLLCSLVPPGELGEKTYAELVAALVSHFNPTPSPIVQRFKFHSHSCEPGESVVVFVSQLHALSEHYNFNDSLEDMLRDRIVCSINVNTIQRRLSAERELSFKKAMEVAQSMETVSRGVKERLKPSSSTKTSRGLTGILKVNQLPCIKDKPPMSCHRYGKPGHRAPPVCVQTSKMLSVWQDRPPKQGVQGQATRCYEALGS